MTESPADQGDQQTRVTVHTAVGGDVFFFDLVNRFYDEVPDEPLLAPMYPPDLTEARRKTALFLAQYWGGPTTYSDERGHPRLRMRHLPFSIGGPERDAWLRLMLAALDEAIAAPPPGSLLAHPTEGDAVADTIRQLIGDYLDQGSAAMINRDA